MKDLNKKLMAVVVIILLLVIPAAIYFYPGMEGEAREKESPSNVWIARLNDAKYQRTELLTERAIYLPFTGRNSALVAVSATAAAVYRTGSEMYYNPVLISDGDDEAINRYFELSEREKMELDASDPESASIELAGACWLKSDFIVLYSDLKNGLAAVPLASYYNIPMVFVNDSAKSLNNILGTLGCKYAISVGSAPIPGLHTMGIAYDSEISLNEFFLWCLSSNNDASDYVVITNPDDIYNTWGEADRIPIAGLSTTAGQIAAYRKATLFFTDGYSQDQLMLTSAADETHNQMGGEIAVANNYANTTKQYVIKASNMSERYGGLLQYLCLVGDPIGVPHYYEYFEGNPFDGTNYAASDYYFSDIVDDEKQDIAFGRIMARSLSDASLLCVRNLGYGEYCEYRFEKGNDVSERFYDTFSEDWRENAGVFVGTSKPLPMPGALKHMKKFHYDVLTSSGMFVTGEESLKLNDVTAAEMLDKMNYIMYCGHGNYFSWYSNRADYIDAPFVNTQKLKPGFAAVMACQTGRTDNLIDPNTMKISLSYIHAGLSGYIGASRLAYGLFKIGDGEQGMLLDTGALYLVDRITCHFAEGQGTIGELFQIARNELIDKYGVNGETDESGEARITCWEYLLYGDPAWVPAY